MLQITHEEASGLLIHERYVLHDYFPSFCERHQCVMKLMHRPFAI